MDESLAEQSTKLQEEIRELQEQIEQLESKISSCKEVIEENSKQIKDCEKHLDSLQSLLDQEDSSKQSSILERKQGFLEKISTLENDTDYYQNLILKKEQQLGELKKELNLAESEKAAIDLEICEGKNNSDKERI